MPWTSFGAQLIVAVLLPTVDRLHARGCAVVSNGAVDRRRRTLEGLSAHLLRSYRRSSERHCRARDESRCRLKRRGVSICDISTSMARA